MAGRTGMVMAFAVAAMTAFTVASLTRSDSAPVVTTTGTTAVSAQPVWLTEGEVVLGPAAIIPEALELDGTEVVLSYELAGLAPLEGIERARVASNAFTPAGELDPADLPPIFPDRWTLVTATGRIPGTTSNLRSRTARFDVPEGFIPATIDEIRLESYRIPVPVDETFLLSTETPRVEVAPGVVVSLIQIVPQVSQTIVQVELVADVPFNREQIHIEGVGPEWRSAVREAEGRPRFNLRAEGIVPEPLTLRARGVVWVLIERPVVFEVPGT